MKTKDKILYIVGFLLLAVILVLVIFFKETPYKQVVLEKNASQVYNKTEQPYLDSVVYLGLDHLNIQDVIVVIKPLEPNTVKVEEGSYLDAHIIGSGKTYVIFTRNLNRSDAVTILSHEMIHLHQYYTGKLQVTKDGIIWEEKPVELSGLSYPNRPWEKEAFALQKDVIQHIKQKLY